MDSDLAPTTSGKWNHLTAQAEIIEKCRPKLYEQILTLLANGHSPHKIWKLTGIESDVVRRIRDLNPETLANLKTTLATSLAEASQLLAERLIEAAPKMQRGEIAKALNIAVDKWQLLSGGVTARTEHRNVATPEELQKLFEALPRANAQIVIENQDNGDV